MKLFNSIIMFLKRSVWFIQLTLTLLLKSYKLVQTQIKLRVVFSGGIKVSKAVFSTKLEHQHTVCIRDLDKLELIWWFGIRLEPIIATFPAASKNTTDFRTLDKINLFWWYEFRLKLILLLFQLPQNTYDFKSGQMWTKTNHLTYIPRLSIHPWHTPYVSCQIFFEDKVTL